MMERDDSLHWLVRETDNCIHGPYTHAEILHLLKSKKIRGKMEIAQANSYWFSLHEKDELEKFFPEFVGTGTNTDSGASSHTTMTKTMASQADSAPTIAEELEQQTTIIKSEEKVEWLSDEFAEEFGLEQESSALPGVSVIEPAKAVTENIAKNLDPIQLLEATKNADSKSDNSKRTRAKIPVSTAASSSHNAANVGEKKNIRPMLKVSVALMVLLLLGVIGVSAFRKKHTGKQNPPLLDTSSPAISSTENFKMAPNAYPQALKNSFLLHDMNSIKKIIVEMEANSKGNIFLPIAKSLLKKYFLFDADGAFATIEESRVFLGINKNLEAEVDNLSGVYSADADSARAISFFKKAAANNSGEKIYTINLAATLYLAGKYAEAEKILLELTRSEITPEYLAVDVYMLLGMVATQGRPTSDASAEAAYKKALDLDPRRADIHLLLAARKLQKFGPKQAEADLHAFLESLPELDSNDRVVNYRLFSITDIYGIARSQLHDALAPNAKPNALYLAVDGLLSTIQNKFAEADGTLEQALNSFAANSDLLKALAYLRWKEGKFSDVVDLLKEMGGGHVSYAVNLLLGRANQKLGNFSEAEKYFSNAATTAPDASVPLSYWGEVLLATKQNTEAIKKFQKALEKNHFDSRAVQNLYKLGNESILAKEIYSGLSPF